MNSAKAMAGEPAGDVVVFGNGTFAALAWHALTNDTRYRVVAFTVDRPYLREMRMNGLPVLAFDEIETQFDPARTAILMSVGWVDANGVRRRKSFEATAKGFRLISYVASRAFVPADIVVGQGSIVFEGATVQPFSCLGDGVILRNGSHISHHVDVGDFCFISSGAVIGGNARLGSRCFIGLNATIRDGVTIGERAIVGAGAVVGRNVEPDATYAAPPARRVPAAARSDVEP